MSFAEAPADNRATAATVLSSSALVFWKFMFGSSSGPGCSEGNLHASLHHVFRLASDNRRRRGARAAATLEGSAGKAGRGANVFVQPPVQAHCERVCRSRGGGRVRKERKGVVVNVQFGVAPGEFQCATAAGTQRAPRSHALVGSVLASQHIRDGDLPGLVVDLAGGQRRGDRAVHLLRGDHILTQHSERTAIEVALRPNPPVQSVGDDDDIARGIVSEELLLTVRGEARQNPASGRWK